MGLRVIPFAKTPHINIATRIQSPVAPSSISANVADIGHRTLMGSETELPRLVPAPGFPQVQYFKPFTLPAFGDGNSALSYMQNLGFRVAYGQSGTLTLPAPSSVVVNTNGTVTLNYTTTPDQYSLLLAPGMTGTVSQATSLATGVFSKASTTSASITLKTVTGTFNTTNLITFAYINNSSSYPDPNRTEEICMMVYAHYTAATQINGPAQFNFIVPACTISVLTDREVGGAFAPNPTPVALGIPTAVSVQTDGSVFIGYATYPANAGYVPISPLGESVLNQATSSATGTIVGVLPAFTIAGCVFVVKVNNVTGTFNTTDAVSLVLDQTADVFSFLDNVTVSAIVNPYNVATNNDIQVAQAAYFDYIHSTNQPSEIQKGHFGTFGVFANTTAPVRNSSVLPTDINFNWYVPTYYPYTPLIGEVPQSPAVIAAATASFGLCNSAPFNPMSGLIIQGLLSSADTSNNIIYGTTGVGSSEEFLDLGWTPLCVNAAGQVYPARLITGQITVPGFSIPDQEFFPMSTWQIVAYFQQQLFLTLEAAGVKNFRMTPLVINNVRNAIIALMNQFENLGMFENVGFWAKKVVVVQSNVPDTLEIDIPAQVIPELASADAVVGLISSLFPINSTAA
jgi:hypothetical protein